MVVLSPNKGGLLSLKRLYFQTSSVLKSHKRPLQENESDKFMKWPVILWLSI